MTNITTAAGRRLLKPQREPYWRKLAKGRYVGYRVPAGTWHARIYLNGRYEPKPLDGARDYEAAVAMAEAWFAQLSGGAEAHYLVDDAVSDYVDNRRIEKGERSAHEADLILRKHLLPAFKGRELSSLTSKELTRWRNAFALPGDGEAARRSKETANKYISCTKAAFNYAFKELHVVATDVAWRRLAPFKDTDKPREFFPSVEQVEAVIAHCDDALRPLVRAMAETGFRLQPLTDARVADFDPIEGTLNIERDKKHKRNATLSTAAIALFKEQARDKLPSAYLFTRGDGLPWKKSQTFRPWRAACDLVNADPAASVKIPRTFVLYGCRHFAISRALRAGVDINALAKVVGTSPTMIQKHYQKFIRSDVRAMLDRVA